MSTATGKQQDKKPQQQENPPVQTAESAPAKQDAGSGLRALCRIPSSPPEDSAAYAVARHLGNRRIPAAQRRALAVEASRVQGNRFLQRAIAIHQASPGLVQREFRRIPGSAGGATYERRGSVIELVMPWSIEESAILENVFGALRGAVSRGRRWESEEWVSSFREALASHLAGMNHPSAGHGTMQRTNPHGGSDLTLYLHLVMGEGGRVDAISLRPQETGGVEEAESPAAAVTELRTGGEAAEPGPGEESAPTGEQAEGGAEAAEEEPAAEPLDYQTARTVLDAVIQILSAFGVAETVAEVEPGRVQVISHPSAHPEVPEPYRNALWDFYKAAQGIEHRNGEWVDARGERRRFWIRLGMRRIRPLMEFALREEPSSADAISSGILDPADEILALANREAASETLRSTEPERALEDPTVAGRIIYLRSAASNTRAILDRANTFADRSAGVRAGTEFESLLDRQGPVSDHEFYTRLRGVRGLVAVGMIADVISAILALMSLMDSLDQAGQQQAFDERLGPLGFTRSGADVLGALGNILQGIIALVSLFCAAVSSVAGFAVESARLLAASRRASGGLSQAVGVLSMIRGVLDIVRPGQTRRERWSGATDVMIGVGPILGGPAAPASLGGAVALTLNLELARVFAQVIAAIQLDSLARCYRRMARDGRDMVSYGNQLLAGPQVLEGEQDPDRRAAIGETLGGVEANLRIIVSQFMVDARRTGRGSHMGAFDALRWRFVGCGSPPTAETSQADLIEQVRDILYQIDGAFREAREVEREATDQALSESPTGAYYEAEDILPGTGPIESGSSEESR
jgi:hypothetical protein